MKNNYYDAFIPSIALGKKPIKLISNSYSLVQPYRIKKINRFSSHSMLFSRSVMSGGVSNDFKKEISSTLLRELMEDQEKVKNPFESLSLSNRRIISVLIFASSVLSGWFLTPSRSKWVSLGVSFLAGSVAFWAIKKFNKTNTFGIQEKLIKIFGDFSDKETIEKELTLVTKEFTLPSTEIRFEILKLYKKLLSFFLRDTKINLEEVDELIRFKSIFNISPQEIGECHYEFAKDLYKDYIVMLERRDSGESNTTVNKFFFLSDRLFALDSKKGYQYESSRIRKIFIFSQDTVEKTCSEISLNLYQKAILTFLEDGVFQNQRLVDVQKTLGITDQEQTQIHLKFFNKKIQDSMTKDSGFSSDEKNTIENIKKLLNIQESTSEQAISEQAGPLFCSDVISILKEINSDTTDSQYNTFAQSLIFKKNSLLLASDLVPEYFLVGVKKTAEELIRQILKNLRFQKKDDINVQVEKLVNLSMRSINLFELVDQDKKKVLENSLSVNLDNIGSQFSSKELNQLYKFYLEISLSEEPALTVTPEKEKVWETLSSLLSLSSKETEENYRLVATPIFREKIKKALKKEEFSSEEKKQIEILENSLKLEKNICSITKTSAYREILEEVIENGKILNQDDLTKLNQIRVFLSLKWENVQNIHDTISEPIFKKSVLEAMGATGIIPSNYWQGLENLRKRLLLTENKSKEILYKCVKEKLKTIFEKALVENKKKNSPQNNDPKDSGDDPTVSKGAGTALGIEAGDSSGNQLFNLIDLYFRNQIFIENEEVFSENKRNSLKGMSGRSEVQVSSKSKPNFSYPVTLRGQFDEKNLNEMYRQYLVDCFSAKLQSEKRRLFNNLDKLGPILGLSPSQINSIHSNVGVVIYQKYLSQALSKGFLDQSDNTFLSNIQATLSMDSTKCSEIVKEGKRSAVNFKVEQIFASPNVNSDRVSEMRKLAYQFGIDLKNDLGVSQEQRSKMFRVEIDSGIERGQITNESQNLIKEIQNGFGLEDDVSKKILLDCITTRCEGHLVNAIASLRRGVDKEVINELEKMVSFGNLLPNKTQTSIGSKNEKIQLLDLFQSYSSEINSDGKFEEKLQLLKLMLDI